MRFGLRNDRIGMISLLNFNRTRIASLRFRAWSPVLFSEEGQEFVGLFVGIVEGIGTHIKLKRGIVHKSPQRGCSMCKHTYPMLSSLRHRSLSGSAGASL